MIKVNSRKARCMDKEFCFLPTVKGIQVKSRMEWLMELECIPLLMVRRSKADGLKADGLKAKWYNSE